MIKLHVNTRFTAMYHGERHHFVVVEHLNIGEGWMCRELDGKLRPGVYLSGDMTEIMTELD